MRAATAAGGAASRPGRFRRDRAVSGRADDERDDENGSGGAVGDGAGGAGVGGGSIRFVIDPDDPFRCEVEYELTDDVDRPNWYTINLLREVGENDYRSFSPRLSFSIARGETVARRVTHDCGRFRHHDGLYWAVLLGSGGTDGRGGRVEDSYRTPPAPTPPEPPEPPPPEPEPETPEPEACPVERCDHLAIVPVIPRALSGDEDAPDHWLHVANPGPGAVTFTVTGRDMAGTKGGTYRRELPAYRSVRVMMRDIEAAFDVSEPEGWWTLTVTGSGPLYVAATMRQGDARRFVPVERPAVCGSER